MRLGIDLGGTKIEIIALNDDGGEVLRHRVPTPRGTYRGILNAIAELVREAETRLTAMGHSGPHSVGLGIPGTISKHTGLAINSNSTEMNGQPLQQDLEALLGRPLRFQNDANCLAVSEAVDGAGAGAKLVFAAILGTGCGAGIAIDGQAWEGRHRVAGEWGHNPLPWPSAEEFQQAETCWCGRHSCLETWISGSGFQHDYARATGQNKSGPAIIAEAMAGDDAAEAALSRYISRLGRALAHVINLIDPDVIVLGGGMSGVAALYPRLPDAIRPFMFADHFSTPILPAQHGDSSGVRGAAWLWGRGNS